MASLTLRLKEQAQTLGFQLVGVAPAVQAPGWQRFQDWLHKGYAAEMKYLQQGATARGSLDSILPGCRSIMMMGISYHQPQLRNEKTPINHGRVATYALGDDYHPLLWAKLNQLSAWLSKELPGSVSRGVVDTAPLLERDYARLAGLGWFGKNTMLINKHIGSCLLLSALLTTIDLELDQPHLSSHCGTCSACLDACPTQAFPEPGVLDASKCISYFTIEKRGSIPVEYRDKLGEWVFGCDICQDVCPWNRKAPKGQEAGLLSSSWHHSDEGTVDLVKLLMLEELELRCNFRGTALWRAKRQGLLRNACLILGNRGDCSAIPALQKAMKDEDEVIRESAKWALHVIQQKTACSGEQAVK